MTKTEACRRVALAALLAGVMVGAHEARAGIASNGFSYNGLNLSGVAPDGTYPNGSQSQDLSPSGAHATTP